MPSNYAGNVLARASQQRISCSVTFVLLQLPCTRTLLSPFLFSRVSQNDILINVFFRQELAAQTHRSISFLCDPSPKGFHDAA